jgi:hypothetical protein
MDLLDFENEKYQKGYKKFNPKNRDLVKKNIGKRMCYVTYVDPYRGYFTVEYGIIHSTRYSTIYMNDMEKQVDIRDIIDCGIELSGIES